MNIRDIFNPLNEKREYHYAGKFVSEEGMKSIRALLLTDEAYALRYNYPLGDAGENISPEWLVTTGPLQGTLPKRIAHLIYKNSGAKIPKGIVSEIGNIAARHCGNGQDYVYDITPDFDWREGDFGDTGSCYWGGRASARDMLKEHDSLAIRFYKDSKGYGRAWIIFPKPSEVMALEGKAPENICIVYNSYPSSHPLCRVARLIATLTGLSYKGPVRLENRGSDDGALYINGGKCYVIGSPSDIENITGVNLNWEDEDMCICSDCGCAIDEDELLSSPDGEDLCSDCFHNSYFSCDRCFRTFDNGDCISLEDGQYCERCAIVMGYGPCYNCGEWSREVDQRTGNDNTYCPNCWEEEYGDCKDCGETHILSNLTDGLCPECREKEVAA